MKNFILLGIALVCITFSYARKTSSTRLLYWNIQNGMWDGQTDNYARFTQWVKNQQPDICVWCEAQKLYRSQTADREVETEQQCLERWKKLAKDYGHKYVRLSAHRDNYPQLITSRYPIDMQKRIVGNGKDSIVSHGASWSVVKVNGKRLNIVTLHTWPQSFGFGIKDKKKREESARRCDGDRYRKMEMEYICKETILRHPDANQEMWMMMGDFNSITPADDNYYHQGKNASAYLLHDYILTHTPYVDIIKHCHPDTPCLSTPHRRIDFVYLTTPLVDKVTRAETIWDDYTTPVRNKDKISNFWHPSDHCPIIVDFNWNQP